MRILAARWNQVLLLCVMLLAFAVAGHSEEQVENYDSGEVKAKYTVMQGKKHGNYLEFYKDGSKKVVAKYRDDQLDGSYREYYPSGKTKRKAKYDEGKLDSSYVEYYENGKKKIDADYDEGKLDGDYTEYAENGDKLIEAEYANGLLNGERKVYKDDDVVRTEIYTEGILSHPRSQKEMEEEFKRLQSEDLSANPGTPEHHDALRRLKQYRYLVGVPYKDLVLDEQLNMYADYGARICAAIGKITHHPKNVGWPEEDYKKAKYGTGKANLSWNTVYAKSVDMYMYDSDSSNVGAVGHRRWCINPSMGKVGFGATSAGKKGSFGSMTAHDTSNKGNVPDFDFIAYPTPGYNAAALFPKGRFFKDQHAWNITLNPKKYEKPKQGEVSVKVYDISDSDGGKKKRRSRKKKDEDDAPAGKEMPIENFKVENTSYGMSHCIIFRPKGFSTADGAKYKVVISGVTPKSGKSSANGGELPGANSEPLVYYVEFFNPQF